MTKIFFIGLMIFLPVSAFVGADLGCDHRAVAQQAQYDD